MNESTAELPFVPRSTLQWLPMLLPMILCGMSWGMGGVPFITDLGFTVLTGLCIFFLICEFYRFPKRFGIGGVLLYGGVLIWFCHDYFTHWFACDFNAANIVATPEDISRVAFFHCLFILMMVFGLSIKSGRWLTRIVLAVPEPGSETFYFIIMALLNIVGFSAFFFTEDGIGHALYAAAFGIWTGDTINWTVGRTGNLNFNWGGYVAQIIQVGQVGGLFAVMMAIVITRKTSIKIIGWILWAFWTLQVASGGRRGDMAFMMFPPIAFLFIKYQSQAAMQKFGRGALSYIIAGAFCFVLLVVVQIEGTWRDVGLANADLGELTLTTNRGNSMFSEGLYGWILIPSRKGFFANRFVGEGFVRPIPEQVYRFAIGMVPRALWHDKPVDGLWEWYNTVVTGNANGREGTTISHGLVGSWYFNYGIGGVLEGGLLVGWLMSVCERSLQESDGRPIGMLMSLSMAVWLFRCYRDFQFNEIYAIVIGGVLLTILVTFFRPLFGQSSGPAIQHIPHEAVYGAGYGT